jgi:hypothetical protein
MRLEATNRDDTYKVWMTDPELETLRRAAADGDDPLRDDLVIQLGGYVGLRAFEVPQIQARHIKRTDDGDHYRFRVPRGKGHRQRRRQAT